MKRTVFLFLALPLLGQDSTTKDPSEDIDRLVDRRLSELGLAAAPPASDAAFFRRVHIDLIGRLPDPSAVRAFLRDSDPKKRDRLVERLLRDPRYAEFWSEVWLRTLVGYDPYKLFADPDLDMGKLRAWLQAAIDRGRPFAAVVRDLLSAEGDFGRKPQVHFLGAYVKPGQGPPLEAATAVARIFLGYRLQCARCHDHPFDRWTQEDFWGWAALFARTRRRRVNTFNGIRAELVEHRRGEIRHNGETVAPRFLDGTRPDSEADRRRALAVWLTSRRQFARAVANRIWAHFFGKGLVDPADGFGDLNQPSHPELLEFLTDHFLRSGTDLRDLMRTIVRSRTYRRTSRVTGGTDPRPDFFTHHRIRPMHPVALFNALVQALNAGAFVKSEEFRKTRYTIYYLLSTLLGQSAGTDEAVYRGTIQQALVFMNGRDLHNGLQAPTGHAAQVRRRFRARARRVQELFLLMLGRPPTPPERRRYEEFLRRHGDSHEALVDVLWVLMNSSEFFFNH